MAGSGSSYQLAVSGMSASGTVIATIKGNAATDAAGNSSSASGGGDNSVSFTDMAAPGDDRGGKGGGSWSLGTLILLSLVAKGRHLRRPITNP